MVNPRFPAGVRRPYPHETAMIRHDSLHSNEAQSPFHRPVGGKIGLKELAVNPVLDPAALVSATVKRITARWPDRMPWRAVDFALAFHRRHRVVEAIDEGSLQIALDRVPSSVSQLFGKCQLEDEIASCADRKRLAASRTISLRSGPAPGVVSGKPRERRKFTHQRFHAKESTSFRIISVASRKSAVIVDFIKYASAAAIVAPRAEWVSADSCQFRAQCVFATSRHTLMRSIFCISVTSSKTAATPNLLAWRFSSRSTLKVTAASVETHSVVVASADAQLATNRLSR